ncbi:MAG: hypothetical protein MZU95_03380 [Desulfomicrobium escambiense]|nr:hypothetical protein [Desulfomicrobium escambiense]
MRMLPQPLGSILNLLMDGPGAPQPAGARRRRRSAWWTSGFAPRISCIMDRLRHIDRGSRTIDSGISKAFGLIAQKLQEKCGCRRRALPALPGGRGRHHPHARQTHQLRQRSATRCSSSWPAPSPARSTACGPTTGTWT